MSRADESRPGISTRRTILWFAGAGIAAMLVLVAGGVVVIRQQATSEAVRDARTVTRAIAQGVISPNIEDGLLVGDPAAVSRLDAVVRASVLSGEVVRIKLWTADGRILYSDESRIMARQFEVDEDLRLAATRWETLASVSDLDRPENEFERPFGKLLEVYQPLRMPGGEPVVLELYQRYNSISANEFHIFTLFVPVLIGSLGLLQAFQIPLAWSMASRLQSGQRARELLLERAVQAQALERKRIARDIHDGVVQDMIGLSLSLSASADAVGRDQAGDRDLLRDSARGVRRAIRSLRGFLVEIYPPTLEQSGLEAALSDLVEPLHSRNIGVGVELAGLEQIGGVAQSLIYRAAQEAVRNVARHADAKHVGLSVVASNGRVVLTVEDDGVGFDANGSNPGAYGHFGLAILRDLASEGGGQLQVESAPGRGTTLTLELPAR